MCNNISSPGCFQQDLNHALSAHLSRLRGKETLSCKFSAFFPNLHFLFCSGFGIISRGGRDSIRRRVATLAGKKIKSACCKWRAKNNGRRNEHSKNINWCYMIVQRKLSLRRLKKKETFWSASRVLVAWIHQDRSWVPRSTPGSGANHTLAMLVGHAEMGLQGPVFF